MTVRRAPVIIRPDEFTREGRNAQGKRVKRIYRLDTVNGGRVGGHEHYHPDGSNDAHIGPKTVTVQLSARQFGMTQRELAVALAGVRVLNPPDRRRPSGLHLP